MLKNVDSECMKIMIFTRRPSNIDCCMFLIITVALMLMYDDNNILTLGIPMKKNKSIKYI